MRTLNNHKQVFIGKDINRTAAAVGAVATPSSLADGEVAVCSVDGVVLNDTSVALVDQVVIVQGRGATNPLLVSSPITKSGVKTYKAKAPSAAVAQVDYIGFNAATSTGAIDPINNNAYIVRASLKSNFSNYADKELHVIGDYVSTSAATQALVAAGLCQSLIYNSEKFPNVPFTVERVHSNAGVASSGGAFTVTKGSKTVTTVESAGAAADAGKYNADAATIVAGDYIRIGGTTTAIGVYKVVSITGGGTAAATITLDIPYQGTSGSVSAANVEVITAALAAAGDFGVKLTGKTKQFKEGVWRYEAMKWFTTLENGGSTPVANATAATEGVGTYEQVAEEEWFYQLAEGFADNMTIQIPPVTFRKDATSGEVYSVLDIEWSDAFGTDIIHNPVSHKQIRIFCSNGAAAGFLGANSQFTKNAEGVADVLDTWLSTFTAQESSL